jgi:excisionase family DNA binding protein
MSVHTSLDSPVRLFTIKEAAEALRIPISWLYERTRRNAIPFRRIGKYVRFTQDDLVEIISSSESSRKQTAPRD